jgi:hypothetical protein
MKSADIQQNLNAFAALSSEEPESLQAVFEKEVDGCREKLILRFTKKSLCFSAVPDDDTISVCSRASTSVHESGLRPVRSALWRAFIGKSFGWGWVTVNQQGYCDGVLLSFDGLYPGILLEVVASSILINVVTRERSLVAGGRRTR